MRFKVTFEDIFENCENEIQAYDALLEYLNECVRHEGVEGFNFELIPEANDAMNHAILSHAIR